MDLQHSSFDLLHFLLHPALTPQCNHTQIRSTLPTRGVSTPAIKATFKSPLTTSEFCAQDSIISHNQANSNSDARSANPKPSPGLQSKSPAPEIHLYQTEGGKLENLDNLTRCRNAPTTTSCGPGHGQRVGTELQSDRAAIVGSRGRTISPVTFHISHSRPTPASSNSPDTHPGPCAAASSPAATGSAWPAANPAGAAA